MQEYVSGLQVNGQPPEKEVQTDYIYKNNTYLRMNRLIQILRISSVSWQPNIFACIGHDSNQHVLEMRRITTAFSRRRLLKYPILRKNRSF